MTTKPAPERTKTKPLVLPNIEPDISPDRRLNPARTCPDQRREIVRKIIPVKR